jgi:hypothetical protein
MGSSLAAAGLFAALNATVISAAAPPAAAADAATADALRHLAREGALAALLPCAVALSLGRYDPWRRGLLQARWEPEWAVRTLAACAVLFPLADPVIAHAWAPAAEVGHPRATRFVMVLSQGLTNDPAKSGMLMSNSMVPKPDAVRR